jgi:hypothetical protein
MKCRRRNRAAEKLEAEEAKKADEIKQSQAKTNEEKAKRGLVCKFIEIHCYKTSVIDHKKLYAWCAISTSVPSSDRNYCPAKGSVNHPDYTPPGPWPRPE